MCVQATKPKVELNDGLGDWRFRTIAKVSTSKGLRILSHFGELQAPTGERFSFTDFMATALYLNVAMTADANANELREMLKPEEFLAPAGPYTTITDKNLGTLFDFIEQSVIAATFSFQALEAYSNFVVHFELGDTGTHVFKTKVRPKALMGAEEIQQYGATMDKLKTVVPQLLKVKPPTKEPFWAKLCDMKDARDALTHLKYRDQMGAADLAAAPRDSQTRADPEFVFYKLVSGEISEFPRTAVETLNYFTKPIGTPRWLLYPLSVYGIPETAPKGTISITLGPAI
jgi:hypothetical protein